MGDLPEERWNVGNPPWTAVSVDLMGPSSVKGVLNQRSVGKVWPLIISCLSTGAVHVCLMHTHGTEAFLMQVITNYYEQKWQKFLSSESIFSGGG